MSKRISTPTNGSLLTPSLTPETPEQELARLREENERLRTSRATTSGASVNVWVSSSTGTWNFYGFGQFPKSFHAGHLSRLQDYLATPEGQKVLAIDRTVSKLDKSESPKRLVSEAMRASITVRAPHAAR
jgi:hypothetical protein